METHSLCKLMRRELGRKEGIKLITCHPLSALSVLIQIKLFHFSDVSRYQTMGAQTERQNLQEIASSE